MSRTSRQKGKRVEREVAQLLGGRRNPADGGSHTDIYAGDLAIEVKARKALPKWMGDAMQQAEADLKDGRTMPLVVLVQSRVGALPQRYVLMHLSDFQKLQGTTDAQEDPGLRAA